MKMKSLLGAITLAVVLIGGTNFAYAYNHNHNGTNLTPERQAQYETMLDEHYDSVRPLQDKLRLKYMELNAYQNNANVKPEQISKLINEIASIENEISTQHDKFSNNVKDKLGIEVSGRGHHFGYGQRGNCGNKQFTSGCNNNGYRGGHGQHRGGHGQHRGYGHY